MTHRMKAFSAALLAALTLAACLSCGASSDADTSTGPAETSGPAEETTAAPEKPASRRLVNSCARLTNDKELNIAYIGGSITYGQGASKTDKNWASLTTKWFENAFPDAKITGLNAGMSNTGSNYAIFRLDADVFSKMTPDLVFLEFAVNDWGRFGETNISRQTESLLRMIWERNPNADVVFVYTSLSENSMPRRVSQSLGLRYDLLSIDVGTPTREKVMAEYGGDYTAFTLDKLHPTDAGYALYMDVIGEALSEYFIDNAPEKAECLPKELPTAWNRALFMDPVLLDPDDFPLPESFRRTQKSLKVGTGTQVDHFIETDTIGAAYTFTFTGTGFGLIVYKGADVSNLRYQVDGGAWVDYAVGDMHFYDHTQAYICEYDLKNAEHTVTLENVPSPAGTREAEGKTFRLIKLVVNSPAEP